MKLAFDIKRMKVGCPIIQAAMGGTPRMAREFDTAHWLTHPTDDIRVYEITEEQFKQLLKKVERG
jgi:hypothetical protein